MNLYKVKYDVFSKWSGVKLNAVEKYILTRSLEVNSNDFSSFRKIYKNIEVGKIVAYKDILNNSKLIKTAWIYKVRFYSSLGVGTIYAMGTSKRDVHKYLISISNLPILNIEELVVCGDISINMNEVKNNA